MFAFGGSQILTGYVIMLLILLVYLPYFHHQKSRVRPGSAKKGLVAIQMILLVKIVRKVRQADRSKNSSQFNYRESTIDNSVFCMVGAFIQTNAPLRGGQDLGYLPIYRLRIKLLKVCARFQTLATSFQKRSPSRFCVCYLHYGYAPRFFSPGLLR